MPLFGVHESIARGYARAVQTAADNGFDAVQIFSKNSNQWNAKPIEPTAAHGFAAALSESGIVRPLIHDSYLINLASPKADLWEKSVAAFSEELLRAQTLGVPHVVMHPGAYTESSETEGISQIVKAFDEIFAASPPTVEVLLETTAGQGTNLGWRFEHLADIIARCRFSDRLGVCLDTCHIFAAGYSFATPHEYDAMINEFDSVVGLDRLKAFHLNDSVRELGSRVDRHEAIGYGKIGRTPFGFFLNDPRFSDHPMYLETPKGEVEVEGALENWDCVNLRTLRSLAKKMELPHNDKIECQSGNQNF